MKIQTKIIGVLFLLVAFACSKDDNTPAVVETPKSAAKLITRFSFNAADNTALTENVAATIAESNKTVSSSVPAGTDISALTPSIQISEKATVSPAGAQDFSSQVTYIVTAEDGSKATYTVSLEVEVAMATVDSMSPLSGPKTTIVTFTGTNFGEDTSAVQVFFDDLKATVQSVTNTEIKTVVPPRSFSGEVKIMVNGMEFLGFSFNYEIVDINVSTFAGSESGFLEGNGTNAQFISPEGIAKDNAGNFYISDLVRLRKISAEGEVSTLAGSGEQVSADGVGENASFFTIRDVAVDNSGNIYATDRHKIRKITPEGIVSTLAGTDDSGFADGVGSNALFNSPLGISVDASGIVFVADTGNDRIRKITPEGVVSTIAGGDRGFQDGNDTNAKFNIPIGIEIDPEGTIYVADARNNRIRKISPEGSVTTIAGTGASGFVNGNSNSAQFDFPTDIALDALGNLYVSESANHSVRKINSNGVVSTVVGNGSGIIDGTGVNAQLDGPFGLMIDNSFTIYVADTRNNRIRKITQE